MLALILVALLVIGVGLTLVTGSRELAREQPVVLTPEGAPRQAEAEAASAACIATGSDSGCILYVLERTRDKPDMPALAREYARLSSR